jgi:hypothetical protein
MKKSLLFLVIATVMSAFSTVFAQAPAVPGPPQVLLIVRENIKPGMMSIHNRHSSEYAGIFNKLQTPNHRIALLPVAGSENEVIYITGADKFGELEQIQKTTDDRMAAAVGNMKANLDRLDKELPELHAGMNDMLAVFRPDLSYNAGVEIPTMRYFAITTVRVRPGHEDEFADYVNNVARPARDKAKAELHIAAFQVIAGSPFTTYLFFRPMKSMAEYDLRIGPRVREAMSDDQKKKANKVATEAVQFTETNLYAFNPQMSYVSKEMMAADPGFWSRKAEMVARPKPKKRMMKAATPPPTE